MRREFSDAVGIGAGAHGEHLARTARCAHCVEPGRHCRPPHTHHTLLHDRVAEERQRVAAIAVVLAAQR
ncbi:hypothetical protein [Candidatus Amarobacter glycogenicus]|uniref:hypothetical protein n=1 Tax=Candidatus Amarobacter glycogenicus TaxID=3140699 RepID=UPI0031CC4B2A